MTEAMRAIRLRDAGACDAAAIGTLHVASWGETYSGLVPAETLAGLSAEDRSRMWQDVLEDPARFGGTSVFVAEEGPTLVGFATCGAQRDEALKAQGWEGEIGALYVLRAYQGAGVGKSLMRLMAGRLLDQGCKAGSLWVLRENLAARRFYERLCGTIIAEKQEEQSGTCLSEVAYGWRDLSALT